MKNFNLLASTAMVAGLLYALPASAALVDDFDTAGTSGWTVDRYAPATFNDGVAYNGRTALVETLSASDYKGVGSFYNTQGMALNLAPGTTSMSIDLFVDSAFQTQLGDGRVAGFWATGSDGSAVSAYPIVELHNSNSGLSFKGWDNVTGTYFNIANLGAGDLNTWQTLEIDLVGTNLVYKALGQTATSSAEGTTSFQNVILQGHNNNQALSIGWDNLQAGVGGVPEPSSWALMIMGFGGAGAALRSRRRKTAFA